MFEIRKVGSVKKTRSFPWKKAVVTALTIARPLSAWYGSWKKRKQQERHVGTLKRIVVILLAVLLGLVIVCAVARALVAVKLVNIDTFTSLTGTAIQKDENGFVNLVLIGQGDDDHDGKDLTDTIIVASIDPSDTESVAMLSLPRDLYFLNTEKMGKGKLNTFYRDYKSYLQYREGMEEGDAATEALREIGKEIGAILNLDIQGVIKVNFTAFTEAVDLVGGIDVDVPYTIDDELYPDNNYGYDPFYIEAGMQHLNGTVALKYARSRSTTSDFGRSARQQQVIRALGNKAKAEGLHKNPSAIVDFLHIFNKNVESTLTISEMVGLASLGTKIETNNVYTMQLSDRNALYDYIIEPGGFLYNPPRNLFDGAAVLLPISIPEFPVTWKQIGVLSKLYFQNRWVHLEKPSIAVLNNGAPEGTARRFANELTRYGYRVETIANASLDETEKSFVYAHPEDKKAQAFFSSLLNMEAAEIPEGLPEEERERITIVIGSEGRYKPLQSLLDTSE